MSNKSDSLWLDLKETIRIELKLLKTNEPLTFDEVSFIKTRAEEGVPKNEFVLGLYYLIQEENEFEADKWWTKFFYHANGYGLWKASGIFAYLGDQYYEWSMRCLRRSAWRQFPIAKRMLKAMKLSKFKFAQA